jgi:hypothetical protein
MRAAPFTSFTASHAEKGTASVDNAFRSFEASIAVAMLPRRAFRNLADKLKRHQGVGRGRASPTQGQLTDLRIG